MLNISLSYSITHLTYRNREDFKIAQLEFGQKYNRPVIGGGQFFAPAGVKSNTMKNIFRKASINESRCRIPKRVAWLFHQGLTTSRPGNSGGSLPDTVRPMKFAGTSFINYLSPETKISRLCVIARSQRIQKKWTSLDLYLVLGINLNFQQGQWQLDHQKRAQFLYQAFYQVTDFGKEKPGLTAILTGDSTSVIFRPFLIKLEITDIQLIFSGVKAKRNIVFFQPIVK